MVEKINKNRRVNLSYVKLLFSHCWTSPVNVDVCVNVDRLDQTLKIRETGSSLRMECMHIQGHLGQLRYYYLRSEYAFVADEFIF